MVYSYSHYCTLYIWDIDSRVKKHDILSVIPLDLYTRSQTKTMIDESKYIYTVPFWWLCCNRKTLQTPGS